MGTERFLTSCLGVWHCGAKFWAFCPTQIYDLCCQESTSLLRVSSRGLLRVRFMAFPPRMCFCAHIGIHALHGHKQMSPGPPAICTPRSQPQAQGGLIRLCRVPTAAQRADVGGEAAGTSINHSQMLLQHLQELLRQGNASDVILRVQVAGTDEVRVFHAHRLLLGLHSELFQELLSNRSEVALLEHRDCAAVFDKFIRWGGDGLGGGSFTPSQAPAPPLTGSQ